MKKLTVYLFSPLAFIATTLFLSHQAFAACQPIYGGGETCQQNGKITIDKSVQQPNSTIFSDNVSDQPFKSNQTIIFHITIRNTENNSVKNLIIKDSFPSSLDYINSDGSFDRTSRVLSIPVENLDKNETKIFTIQGKVTGSNGCQVNQVVLESSDNKSLSQDTTSFCITNGKSVQSTTQTKTPPKMSANLYSTQSATKTPATGPNSFALLTIVIVAIGGIFLRKKSNSLA